MNSTIQTIEDLEKLPEVQAGVGIWQNDFHRHDVFGHTVEVVRILKYELDATRELIAAGWLHDIGKPVTKVPKIVDGVQVRNRHNGRPYHSFPNHENKGEEMVRGLKPEIFERLELDQDRIARIVGLHFMPMERVKNAKKEKTREFFIAQIGKLSDDLDVTKMRSEVLTIFYADKKSQKSSDLNFLLALREYLLMGKGDLENLFNQFKLAYSF